MMDRAGWRRAAAGFLFFLLAGGAGRGSWAAGVEPDTPATAVGEPRPGPQGWGAGDERGNGNTQGPATRRRCAVHLLDPEARVYELGRVLSATMPQSPFGDGEVFSGGLGSQGTQLDALGHFGFLDTPWPGTDPFPAEQVRYYNGFTQAEVKPSPGSPLLKLGVDKAVPIVTSAVMLDAVAYRGRRLHPGERVTAADIRGMLHAQGLQPRGILPGDAVFVHTGWGSLWDDPAQDPLATEYYANGPGLAVDAQEYLAARKVVLVALDNPFTDPVPTPPPPHTLPHLPFGVHHNNLTRDGIFQIQNLVLDEMARDRVSLSCVMVLPLRILGGSGSAVRPVAVGAPRRRIGGSFSVPPGGWPTIGREVAVKVLPAESSADPDRLRRFEHEAKATGALNYPNLVAVFDTSRHEGNPYVVFELLHGVTLRQRLGGGLLPARKAVDYAVQIAHGLAAVHESAASSRMPSNVMDEGAVVGRERDA